MSVFKVFNLMLSVYSQKERRFLVIDVLQLILVKPDSRRLGWGVVKFVGFLQVKIHYAYIRNLVLLPYFTVTPCLTYYIFASII